MKCPSILQRFWAQGLVGLLYGLGWGVAKDDSLAFVYYEKAAHQGDAVSQFYAGQCHRKGRGEGRGTTNQRTLANTEHPNVDIDASNTSHGRGRQTARDDDTGIETGTD